MSIKHITSARIACAIEFMLYKTTGHTNSRVGRRGAAEACSRATFPRDARASATPLLYTTCAGRAAANV